MATPTFCLTQMKTLGALTMRRKVFRPVHLLLAIPFVALLWVPFYNRIEPQILGVPFFYWYQLLWIPLGALVLLAVYSARTDSNSESE